MPPTTWACNGDLNYLSTKICVARSFLVPGQQTRTFFITSIDWFSNLWYWSQASDNTSQLNVMKVSFNKKYIGMHMILIELFIGNRIITNNTISTTTAAIRLQKTSPPSCLWVNYPNMCYAFYGRDFTEITTLTSTTGSYTFCLGQLSINYHNVLLTKPIRMMVMPPM